MRRALKNSELNAQSNRNGDPEQTVPDIVPVIADFARYATQKNYAIGLDERNRSIRIDVTLSLH
jgi:hypothetical protein